MLHWYRLVRATRQERSHSTPPSQLIAHGPVPPKDSALADLPEERLTASLTPEEREKLFWLGLIEAAPLFAGGAFSLYTDSKLHTIIAAFVAIALTSIICWFLRNKTPLTRIELTRSETHDHSSRRSPPSGLTDR